MVGSLNGQKIMDEDDVRVDRWDMVAMKDHHTVARMGICIDEQMDVLSGVRADGWMRRVYGWTGND